MRDYYHTKSLRRNRRLGKYTRIVQSRVASRENLFNTGESLKLYKSHFIMIASKNIWNLLLNNKTSSKFASKTNFVFDYTNWQPWCDTAWLSAYPFKRRQAWQYVIKRKLKNYFYSCNRDITKIYINVISCFSAQRFVVKVTDGI